LPWPCDYLDEAARLFEAAQEVVALRAYIVGF
jgi:hypothetical protein